MAEVSCHREWPGLVAGGVKTESEWEGKFRMEGLTVVICWAVRRACVEVRARGCRGNEAGVTGHAIQGGETIRTSYIQ